MKHVFPILALAGCAQIASNVRIVEIPEGSQHVSRTVKDSRDYAAQLQIRGTTIAFAITTHERCEEADVPIVRKIRITDRHEVQKSVGITSELLIGAAGVVLGGLLVANPERGCRSDGTSEMTDPQTCVALGWAVVAAGGVGVGIGLVDTIRLADSKVDLGTQEGPYEAKTTTCHEGPLARMDVVLQLGGGAFVARKQTSANGEVEFDLLDAPEHAIPTKAQPGELRVATDVLPLAITEDQASLLSGALYDAPGSRVARDAADGRKLRCDGRLDRAEKLLVRADTNDADVETAREAWRDAKSKCADDWTVDHQRRRDVGEVAIVENRVAAVLLALTTSNLERVDELVEEQLLPHLRGDAGVRLQLERLVIEPTQALVKGKAEDAIQHRLCRARQTFLKIRGAKHWADLKAKLAQSMFELRGLAKQSTERLMDAAPCS